MARFNISHHCSVLCDVVPQRPNRDLGDPNGKCHQLDDTTRDNQFGIVPIATTKAWQSSVDGLRASRQIT